MCDHETSIGSYASSKRICLDCGKHWIKDASIINYVMGFNPETSTISDEGLQQEWEQCWEMYKREKGLEEV